MKCKYCGCEMDYVGIQDGGGDYGSAVCDEFECPECGWVEESGCVEYDDSIDTDDPDFQQGYTDGKDFEDFYPPEDDPNHLVPPTISDVPF